MSAEVNRLEEGGTFILVCSGSDYFSSRLSIPMMFSILGRTPQYYRTATAQRIEQGFDKLLTNPEVIST